MPIPKIIQTKERKITDLSFDTLNERLETVLLKVMNEKTRHIIRDIVQETLEYERLNLKFKVCFDYDNHDFWFDYTMNDKNSVDMQKLVDRLFEIKMSKLDE
jgi:hypothetical protein